jgi:hypothetical protein
MGDTPVQYWINTVAIPQPHRPPRNLRIGWLARIRCVIRHKCLIA